MPRSHDLQPLNIAPAGGVGQLSGPPAASGARIAQVGPGSQPGEAPEPAQQRQELDEELSKRFIALDPQGYFLIRIEAGAQELVVEHYSNSIDERGLATDPDTGEVIACRGSGPRRPQAVYRGRTAKQLGVTLTEGDGPSPLSRLDHALYLGRELQRAEACLAQGLPYVQD